MIRHTLSSLLILAFLPSCTKEEPPKPAPPPPPPAPAAKVEAAASDDAKSVRLRRRQNRVAGPGAAMVNGYPILVAEVNDLAMVYCQQAPGGCPDEGAKTNMKRAALDFLIDLELVTQAALDKGLTASTEEIQQKIEAMIAEMGGMEKYQEVLTQGGYTEAESRDDASDEILRSKLLKQVRDQAQLEGRDPRIAQQDFIVTLRSSGKVARYEEY